MPDDRNMRERLARRLALQYDLDEGFPPKTAQRNADECWRNFLKAADAILDELREPTEAMMEAARALGPDLDVIDYWQAALTAAKQERG